MIDQQNLQFPVDDRTLSLDQKVAFENLYNELQSVIAYIDSDQAAGNAE